MGQALYRKYRSKSLSEIVGQEHIITTLQNAIKKGSISHAYLFTGPRGVGKTSIARILAHEINGLDYGSDTPHIDIIEIDAASNRRIDEIRDLRDKVHIAPTSAKYKIYIIDEVHMLTKEAFNALLKTLEEPPAHVIFILATTEAHKLPETIISRTQRFHFKSIEPTQAVEHLRMIAQQEKLTISDEALELIAEHGDGSFRDSIGLLDQVSSLGRPIEADDVRDMLGIAPNTIVEALLQATLSGTPKTIIETLEDAAQHGYEPSLLAKQLMQAVRQQLLSGSATQPVVMTGLLNELIEVSASSDPALKLEVVLLGINLSTGNSSTGNSKSETLNTKETMAKPEVKKTEVAAPKAIVEKPKSEALNTKEVEPVQVTDDLSKAWGQVLQAVKAKYNTLYGVLRMAQPSETEDGVVLHCQFAFHQKRLNEAKNKQIVTELLSAQLGKPVAVSCVVEASKTPSPPPKAADQPTTTDSLQTISNIFGAAEVLES
ncbi:MAG: polymerase subunit gamma/tau [Patescibacteria group bacterium]|nr:polymerase subunit gamma/tau [Patescibacteria group bacterium]